jgi:hypothetical protein
MINKETDSNLRELTKLTARRWRQEDAETVLAAWEKSGLSLSRFAGTQGVNVQRLIWWRKKRGHAGRHLKRQSDAVSFIPAVMKASPATVVLRLPHGVDVEVTDAAAVPAEWLAAAVKALEGLP